jgi:hypothetical protein
LLDTARQTNTQNVALILNDMDKKVMHSYLRLLYQLIITVIRTRNRPMMQQYALIVASQPMEAGFSKAVESHCIYCIGEYMISRLRFLPELKQLSPQAEEYIPVVIHMAIDQIEDQAELLRMQNPRSFEEQEQRPLPVDNAPLEEVVIQLEELCNEALSGQSWTSPLYMTWGNERATPFS